MTREEALLKLDEAIRDNTFHHSARDAYSTWCNTPMGREDFEKILNLARQIELKRATRAARKAASRGKEAV